MTYRTSVSLRDEHEEQIEAEKERIDESDPGVSTAVRSLLDRAAEADELRNEVGDLRNRIDDLRDQLAAANTRIDASNELVEYVEHEKQLQSRRSWREEQKAHAGLLTRTKWSLVGMPEPPEEVGPQG